MLKPVGQLSKEIAEIALRRAQYAGYEVRPERDLFVVSDLGNLEIDIAYWIDRFMRPTPKPPDIVANG